MIDVDELEYLAREATPGPWVRGMVSGQCRKPSHATGHPGARGPDPCDYGYQIDDKGYCRRYVSVPPNITLIGSNDHGPVLSSRNAASIAAVNPSVVLELIAEIRRLREEVGSADAIKSG